MNAEKPQEIRLKGRCSDPCCMSETGAGSLLKDKKEAVPDRKGQWMPMLCPDGVCLTGPEHFGAPVESSGGAGKGVWVKTFRPGKSCEVSEITNPP